MTQRKEIIPERDQWLKRDGEGNILPHTCPFKDEVNDDSQTLCICDENDTQECKDSV